MADIELVIKIPKDYYNYIKNISDYHCTTDMLIIKNGTPLDNITDEIKTLKHEHTDVSGYRWWNNAIDNALDIIRDIVADEGDKG